MLDSIEVANDRVWELMANKDVTISAGASPYPHKRIIDGHTYNTKTATEVAQFCCNYEGGYEQYRHLWETLYQTKKGAFFIVVEGMEGTPWCGTIPDTHDPMRGFALVPLSAIEVKQWLGIRELENRYEEIFGAPDEAPGDKEPNSGYRIALQLDQSLARQLKDNAEILDLSLDEFIKEAIAQKLAAKHGVVAQIG